MNPLNPQHSPAQSQNVENYIPQHWVYPPYSQSVEEEPINLLDYWRVLMKRKWLIFAITFFCTVLAYGITKFMPKKYRVEVTLMPITSGGGGLASMAASFSNIPMIGGQLGDLGSKLAGSKNKEIANILKSRTISEEIIAKYSLLKNIFPKIWDEKTQSFKVADPKYIPIPQDGVGLFQKKIFKVEDDVKSGLIKIRVTMGDPQLATKVANGLVVSLQDFINNNSLTLAKRNRIFIEEQLVKTKAKLLEAGIELNQFYANNKISSVLPLLNVNLGSYQKVPEPFEEFREEFNSLDQHQKKVEALKENIRVSNVPGQVYQQFLTLNREILNKTFALLTQQYELAKIEEAKEDLAFQVIDKAKVPRFPSSPQLKINLALGLGGGFIFAIFLVFFLEYIQKMRTLETGRK